MAYVILTQRFETTTYKSTHPENAEQIKDVFKYLIYLLR